MGQKRNIGSTACIHEQGARLLEDIVRWGVEALFSPEALAAPPPAAAAASDAAAAGQSIVKAERGAAAADSDAAQNGGAAAQLAASADNGTAEAPDASAAAASVAAEEAPVLAEPALQRLASIADEIRKRPDWTPAALAGDAQPATAGQAAAPDASAASAANGAIANRPAGGNAIAANGAAGGAEAPRVLTGLGPGLEGVVTREWQPNECEEDEVSEAGARRLGPNLCTNEVIAARRIAELRDS